MNRTLSLFWAMLAVWALNCPLQATIDPAFAPDNSIWEGRLHGLAAFDDGVAVALGVPPYVVRLDHSGKKQDGFEVLPVLTERPEFLRALPDGCLLVVTRTEMIRLMPDGQTDASFEDPLGDYRGLQDVQIGGGIWLAGHFRDPRTQQDTGVLRLLESGAVDPTFQSAVTEPVTHILPAAPQDAVYVSGNFGQDPETFRTRFLRRLQWDGQPDANFGPAADGDGYFITDAVGGRLFNTLVKAMAVDGLGRLWIAASLSLQDTTTEMTVITPDGQVQVTDWQRVNDPRIDQLVIRNTELEGDGVEMHLLGRFRGMMGRSRPLAAGLTWQQTEGIWTPELESAVDLRPALPTSLMPQLDAASVSMGPGQDTYLAVRVGDDTQVIRLGQHVDVPEPPLGLSAAATGADAVRFTWERAAFADTVFLEQWIGDGWTTIMEGDLGRQFAVATGLEAGQSYEFRLRAVNSRGETFSESLTGTTKASAFSGALDVSFLPDLNSLRFAQEGKIVDHQVLTNDVVALATERDVGLFDRTGAWIRTLSFGSTRPDICCLDRDAEGRLLVAGDHLGGGDYVRRYLPDGTRDTGFQTSPFDRNPFITSMAVHGAGVLVGGVFELGARASLVRLLEDGSIDTDFISPSADQVAEITAISVGPEDSFFVAGRFDQWQGRSHRGLAKVLPDGRLDPAFMPGHSALKGFETINALLALEDGGALVAGFYQDGERKIHNDLVKVQFDGNPDPDFYRDQRPGGDVQSLLSLPGGGWLVGGHFIEIQGIARARLAMLDVDGRVEADVNPGLGLEFFVDRLDALSYFGEGKVVASGVFEGYQDVLQPGAAVISLSGETGGPPTLPTSISVEQIGATTFRVEWSPATNHEGYRVETRLVGGDWELAATLERQARFTVVAGFPEETDLEFRLQAFAGEKTTRWSQPLRKESSVNLQPAQGLTAVVSGVEVSLSWAQIVGASDVRVERRLTTDGDWDVVATNGFTAYTDRDLEPETDYGYRVVGLNDFGEEMPSEVVSVRTEDGTLLKEGSLDVGFEMASPPEMVGQITGLGLFRERTPSLVVAGYFRRGEENLAPLIEVNAQGEVGLMDRMRGLLNNADRLFASPDGRVYVSGRHILGSDWHRVTRLKASGERDASFETVTLETGGGGGRLGARTVVPLVSGQVIVAGDFDGASGHATQGVLRLEADGQVDTTFSVSADLQGTVNAVAPLPDGGMMIAGDFVFNHPERRIFQVVRLMAGGDLDLSFDPPFINGQAHALHALEDGRVYVAGNITVLDSNNPQYRLIFRLEETGVVDPTFRLPTHPEAHVVYDMVVEPNGRVLAAGDRLPLDKGRLASLVRYEADGRVDDTFVTSLAFPDGFRTVLISGNFLYATGFFERIDATPRYRVARFHYGVREGTSFSAWLADQQLSQASDETLDIDGDGVPLWQEFVYDLRGQVRDAVPTPLWRDDDGLEVNFQIRRSVPELTVESSPDLREWRKIEWDLSEAWMPVPEDAAYVRLSWMK